MPSSEPTVAASFQGTPITQASGASSQPSAPCSVYGAMTRFTSATSATNTTSMATILSSSCAPSSVPRVMASMAPVASDLRFRSPEAVRPGGTIRKAITSAAGAERMEAISKCATASGCARLRMLA